MKCILKKLWQLGMTPNDNSNAEIYLETSDSEYTTSCCIEVRKGGCAWIPWNGGTCRRSTRTSLISRLNYEPDAGHNLLTRQRRVSKTEREGLFQTARNADMNTRNFDSHHRKIAINSIPLERPFSVLPSSRSIYGEFSSSSLLPDRKKWCTTKFAKVRIYHSLAVFYLPYI